MHVVATPTSSTRTIIVQVQRNVMKEHTGIYIHIAILYGHMLGVKTNFSVTFFTISCLQAVDYLQDNAIITGKHCVFMLLITRKHRVLL